MVGRQLAVAGAALAFLFCASARAEGSVALGGIFRTLGTRVADPQAQLQGREDSLATLPRASAMRARPRNKAASSVRAVVGALVITRDLEVPGLQQVLAFRLIPLKSALGGEANFPLVLRARVGSKRGGVEIGGRF